MGEDRGEQRAHLPGVDLLAWLLEVDAEPEIVLDLDEQVGRPDRAVAGVQPAVQFGEAGRLRRVEVLGRVLFQPPPVVVERDLPVVREKRRRLDELTSALQPGDRLVVSELSRLGRSLGQVIAVLDALAKAGVAFVALKENIRVEGKRDIQTKVMTTLFALFAEVERDLISERTREGLAKARASGRKLGRPKGSLGVSRLDGKEDEIRHFLELGVSKTAIAKITGVSRTTLYSFMTTRGLRLSR